MGQFDFVAPACPESGCCPFAYCIERKNSRLIEGGWEKGTGGVGFVVFGEDVTAFVFVVQSLVHFPWQMEFLSQPERHTHQKLSETSGRITDVGFEESFKFQQGFFIENDKVELFRGEVCGL